MRQVKAIESDAWLQSSSALLTARTLLKMVSNRLPDDDEIGREMVENALDQTESISDALTLLSHEADPTDGDGRTTTDIEDYAQQYETDNSGSSSSDNSGSSSSDNSGSSSSRGSSRKPEGEESKPSSSSSSMDIIDVSTSSSSTNTTPIDRGSSSSSSSSRSRSAVTVSSPVDNATSLQVDLAAEATVVVDDTDDDNDQAHSNSSFFSQRPSSSPSTAQNTARRRGKATGSGNKNGSSSSSSDDDDTSVSFVSDGDGTVDEVWRSSKEEVAVSYKDNVDEEKGGDV